MSKFAVVTTSLALIGALFIGTPAAVYAVANDIYVGSNDATGGSSCADPDFSTDLSDQGNINDALDAALAVVDNDADIIIICDGEYTYAADMPQHNGETRHDVINIEAAAGANVTLNGDNQYQLLSFIVDTSVSVTGINFLDGQVAGDGAAIKVLGGTLTVSDATFTGGAATDDGGAIYSSPGLVTISGSEFTNNSAFDLGGAVYTDGGDFIATDSVFTNNSSENGGAIYISGDLGVARSQFSGNSANNQGGAIDMNNCATVSVSGSTFRNNIAGDSGGGAINFWCDADADVLVSRNTFTGNSARRYGGATDQESSGFVIRYVGNMFTSNSVTDSINGGDGEGGAVWVGNATFSGNIFTRNRASAFGGAVYATSRESARSAMRSKFSGNRARRGSNVYLSR